MAKVKLVIDTSKKDKNGECAVLVQFSAQNKTIRSATDIRVLPDNWKDEKVISGKKGDKDAFEKNTSLDLIKNKCNQKIISNPYNIKKLDVYQLKHYLLGKDKAEEANYFPFAHKRIEELFSQGRIKTARMFGTVRNKIGKYLGKEELDMNDVNKRWIEGFESYCLKSGMKQNGVASYHRYFKWILSDAVDDDLILFNPYKKFEIKTEKTENRNLPIQEVRAIKDYKPKLITPRKGKPIPDPRLLMVRDVFILQFCLAGINLKDLFYLRPSDLSQGRLKYKRSKTGRFYNIKVHPEALLLIEKYKGEKYLLKFADYCQDERKSGEKSHTRKSPFQWKDQDAFGKSINSSLDVICKELFPNKAIKITGYFVRHSVASILRTQRISVSDIAVILGHKEPGHEVTGTYVNEEYAHYDTILNNLINLLFETKEITDFQI